MWTSFLSKLARTCHCCWPMCFLRPTCWYFAGSHFHPCSVSPSSFLWFILNVLLQVGQAGRDVLWPKEAQMPNHLQGWPSQTWDDSRRNHVSRQTVHDAVILSEGWLVLLILTKAWGCDVLTQGYKGLLCSNFECLTFLQNEEWRFVYYIYIFANVYILCWPCKALNLHAHVRQISDASDIHSTCNISCEQQTPCFVIVCTIGMCMIVYAAYTGREI